MEEIVDTTKIAGLTREEYAQLMILLSKVQQPWTHDLYNAFAKLACFTGVEVVTLRWCNSKLQVLLTRRKSGEYYAGQLHSPGSILRKNDALQANCSVDSYSLAIIRVLHELGIEATEANWQDHFARKPVCVPGFVYSSPRGTENCLLVIAELLHEPKNGQFMDVDVALKSHEVIQHNKLVIKRAAWAFQYALPQLRNIPGW